LLQTSPQTIPQENPVFCLLLILLLAETPMLQAAEKSLKISGIMQSILHLNLKGKKFITAVPQRI